MTELEQYRPAETVTYADVAVQRLGEWAQSADAAYKVATRLVESSFVPVAFRGKPVEATAAILAGSEVGISPMSALRAFDIIQGQAAARAITLRAIVQSHGHEMVLTESTNTRCKMRGRRRGSSDWQTVVWTIDRAKDMALTGKDNWKKQPAAMLIARATSELARLIASDAILGLAYSAEEVRDGGSFDEPGDEPDAAPQNGTRRMSRLRPVEEAPLPLPGCEVCGATTGPHDAAVHIAAENPPQPDGPGITRAQQTKIMACYGDLDLGGDDCRDDRLADTSAVVGRDVTSTNDLSRAEAHQLIESLEARVQRVRDEAGQGAE